MTLSTLDGYMHGVGCFILLSVSLCDTLAAKSLNAAETAGSIQKKQCPLGYHVLYCRPAQRIITTAPSDGTGAASLPQDKPWSLKEKCTGSQTEIETGSI